MTDRIERIAWQRYVKRLHQRLQKKSYTLDSNLIIDADSIKTMLCE